MAIGTTFPAVPANPQPVTVLGLLAQACWVAAGALLIRGFVMEVRGGPGGPVFLALITLANASRHFDTFGQGAPAAQSGAGSVGLLVLTAAVFALAAAALGAAA